RPAGTLRRLIAPRTGLLPPTNTKAQINPGLSLSLDEKWGARQVPQTPKRPLTCWFTGVLLKYWERWMRGQDLNL
ncbi:hypothetical protein, partial [Rhodovarius crocodyli]|uniref:hypothetical protein n=1 Tax=Rhodovarius crocodyli TaxID=1979269 RepID=UPI00197EE98E